MTQRNDPVDDVDPWLTPFLPYVGLIAIESARMEWRLSQIVSLLTNASPNVAQKETLDTQVKKIRRSLKDVCGGENRVRAEDIICWTETARDLLRERGDLMHSLWTVASAVAPEDLVSSDMPTGESARSPGMPEGLPVFSRRIRGGESTKRTVGDTAAFAFSMQEHNAMFMPIWRAALAVGVAMSSVSRLRAGS